MKHPVFFFNTFVEIDNDLELNAVQKHNIGWITTAPKNEVIKALVHFGAGPDILAKAENAKSAELERIYGEWIAEYSVRSAA